MKTRIKSLICLLVLVITFAGNTMVFAAPPDGGISVLDANTPQDPGGYSVGSTYTFSRTLTLSEIDRIAEEIYDEQNSSVWTVCSIIANTVPVVSVIYTCLSVGYNITASGEYKFYAGIRTKMINNSYKRVTINYQRKYCRTKTGNNYEYYFELVSHSVKSYSSN